THSRTFTCRVAEVNGAPAAGDSELAERGTKLRCCVLQRRSLRTRRVVGAEAQSKPVAAKARENVQVDVQYLLHRRLTVGEKQIHTFAPNLARTQRRVETLRDLKHACRDERIETRELGDVAQRYDEQMARVDGLNVHEGRALLVAVDEGAGKLAGQDSAKETAARSVVRDCLARSAAEGSRELAAKQDEALDLGEPDRAVRAMSRIRPRRLELQSRRSPRARPPGARRRTRRRRIASGRRACRRRSRPPARSE